MGCQQPSIVLKAKHAQVACMTNLYGTCTSVGTKWYATSIDLQNPKQCCGTMSSLQEFLHCCRTSVQRFGAINAQPLLRSQLSCSHALTCIWMQHARQELCHTTIPFSSILLLIAEACSFLHCIQLPWLTTCRLRHYVNIYVIALPSESWVVQGLQQHKHSFSSVHENSTLNACQITCLLCKVAPSKAIGKLVTRDLAKVCSQPMGFLLSMTSSYIHWQGVTLDVATVSVKD